MEIITNLVDIIPDVIAIVSKIVPDFDFSKFNGIIDSATGLVSQIIALF